jgi:hypothetical protein
MITDILRDARVKGNLVSISDSINAFHSAKMLGMLRRRKEPGLRDIVDAIYMTIVKGNPEIDGKFLEALLNERVIGVKVGKVTDKIGKLPLQKDLALLFESLGIQLTEKRQNITLNLKVENDITTSNIFWRVTFLGLDFLERTSGPDVLKGKTGIFTETWILDWNPNIDIKLVELSSYGSSVEEASENKLIEETQKHKKNFEKISHIMFQSLLMGFVNQFDNIYDICMDSLEEDDQFFTLSRGFYNLIMIHRYMKMVEIMDKQSLTLMRKIIHRNYFSCCFAIPNLANPSDNQQEEIVLALKNLANILNSLSDLSIDHNTFIGSIDSCIDNSENDFMMGSCVGIKYLMNIVSIAQVKKDVLDYVNSADEIKLKLGNFIRGIIFVCQSKIILNKEIVDVFSNVIEGLEWHIFSAILPTLRKAFSELNANDYDIFVEKLAEFYGLKESKFREIREVTQDEFLIFFEEIDEKVNNILKEWFDEV